MFRTRIRFTITRTTSPKADKSKEFASVEQDRDIEKHPSRLSAILPTRVEMPG